MTLSISPDARCQGCALPVSHCCCRHLEAHTKALLVHPTDMPFDLLTLVHPNETPRPSSTSPLISTTLGKNSLYQIWARGDAPKCLANRLAHPHQKQETYLLFPVDRGETVKIISADTLAIKTDTPNKGFRPLVIVLDGNWKEVRKILRQSPWLQDLTRIALSPTKPTAYSLRRHTEAHHLCTAESVAAVLEAANASHHAMALIEALNTHASAYKAWRASLKNH